MKTPAGGRYEADMLVAGRVLVETKAIRALARTDEAQFINYLTATELETGLLLNFRAGRLEFKCKSRTDRATTARQDEQDGQDGQH
jgi:GxxExxY protein